MGTYSPSTNGESLPVQINKPLSLIGTQPLIDASGTSSPVVQISADNVEINGFNITGGTDGIYITSDADGSTISINWNYIYDNTNYGLRNDNGSIVNAENNGWGHWSGPLHTATGQNCHPPSEGGWNCGLCNTNPDGNGDKVSDNVDYCPWHFSGGISEGKCFIATAAYGTSTAAELDTLRAFRDEVLLQNSLGSKLVALYYDISPPMAHFISEHGVLRTLVREFLVDPVVWMVEVTKALWQY
jgi:hypothetical protein